MKNNRMVLCWIGLGCSPESLGGPGTGKSQRRPPRDTGGAGEDIAPAAAAASDRIGGRGTVSAARGAGGSVNVNDDLAAMADTS
jgi:hypothetical protein